MVSLFVVIEYVVLIIFVWGGLFLLEFVQVGGRGGYVLLMPCSVCDKSGIRL